MMSHGLYPNVKGETFWGELIQPRIVLSPARIICEPGKVLQVLFVKEKHSCVLAHGAILCHRCMALTLHTQHPAREAG
jgi:hypothetical protein